MGPTRRPKGYVESRENVEEQTGGLFFLCENVEDHTGGPEFTDDEKLR